ncbi:hypothetical protein, partial [Streptomyces sp. NPDC002537]
MTRTGLRAERVAGGAAPAVGGESGPQGGEGTAVFGEDGGADAVSVQQPVCLGEVAGCFCFYEDELGVGVDGV